MKPTKLFESLLSSPSMNTETLCEFQEYECEICGIPLWDRFARFVCFQPNAKHESDGALLQHNCNVCLDCRDAGVASFPERFRKRAQELEQRACELRQLANAEFVPLGEHCVVYKSNPIV